MRMLIMTRSICSLCLLALVLALSINAAPSTSPQSHQKQVSIVQILLQAEKQFCKAYLAGAKPTQSTIIVTQTSFSTLPASIQTVTNTVTTADQTVTSTITSGTVTTKTDISTVQVTIPTTVTTATTTVATLTVPSTVISTKTVTGYSTTTTTVAAVTDTATVSKQTTIQVTDTTTVTKTSTSTASSTSTVTVTSAPSKRALPTAHPLDRRSSPPKKPRVVQSFNDQIVKDACLILLYGTYSKSPITSTQTIKSTCTASPSTITASPSTVHQQTTTTLIVNLTSTADVTQTTTKDTYSSITATSSVTASTVDFSTITATVTSTSTSIVTATATVVTTTTTVINTITSHTTTTSTQTDTVTVISISTTTTTVSPPGPTKLVRGYISLPPNSTNVDNKRRNLDTLSINQKRDGGSSYYLHWVLDGFGVENYGTTGYVAYNFDPSTGYLWDDDNYFLTTYNNGPKTGVLLNNQGDIDAFGDVEKIKCKVDYLGNFTCTSSFGSDSFLQCDETGSNVVFYNYQNAYKSCYGMPAIFETIT